MDFDPHLRRNIVRAITALISTRESQITWLKSFVKDVIIQERIINSAKTAATVVSVASTIALFTPFAVLGIAGLAGSGVATVGTTIGSFIANKVNDSDLKKKLEQSVSQEATLKNLLVQLQELVRNVSRELGVSVEMAQRLVLYHKEIHEISVAEGNNTLPLMLGGGEAVVGLAQALPKLKQMADVMEFGYGFVNAARVARGASVAIVLEETGQGVQAFYQISGSVVGTVSKCLGVAGAVVGVADVIYSWAKDNPCVSSAKECINKVEQSRTDLRKMKEFFDRDFER